MHLGHVSLLSDTFASTKFSKNRKTGNMVSWYHKRDEPLVDDEIGRQELPPPGQPTLVDVPAYCHVMYVVNQARGFKPHDAFVEVCKMASTDIARARAAFKGATVHCGEVCGNDYFKLDVTMVIDDVIDLSCQKVAIFLIEDSDSPNSLTATAKREGVQPSADRAKRQRNSRAAAPLEISLGDIAGSIYVLKIITTSMQVFYYIGSTRQDPQKRMNAHTTPAGSVLRRLPKNAQVQRMVAVEYFSVPSNHSYNLEEAELMHAAKYMFKHGATNVRGANFLSRFGEQPSHDEVMLLQHLNNLPYN